ncbi:MAG: xanthine dehydrogenase family protein molybdopterin-binding subunit [Gemmatimonadetes bacterium]|nr:xanthine dehydrogenase family protein molybdopterin-binding subunit [Gemmatimonadota bacterium]
MTAPRRLTRRGFLKRSAAAGGGLVIGFHIPGFGAERLLAATVDSLAPNAFVRVGVDDVITIIVHKSEMGQGVFTSLPMILAEELDADWSKVEVEASPSTPEYAIGFGGQLTGGSTSVMTSWQLFREAGATARAMLVDAAARRWNVDAADLRTEAGVVFDAAGDRRATYGELAEEAATLDVPSSVPLKDPADFRIVGTNVRRLEGPDKVTGAAEFSIDVRLPDMLTAVVAHSPVCGGTVRSFDGSAAEALPGVVKVKQVPSGVAVIGRDFWSARQGRDALEIEWDDGEGARLSSAGLRDEYLAMVETPGAVAEDLGDAAAALDGAARTVEAIYEVPYLAHAPMEPLNATVHAKADGADIWAGTQAQTLDQRAAAGILGLRPEDIRIHTTMLGGGFGRRANPTSDFVSDAVAVAKDEGVPVKTVWTREDDIQCGYYRPMFVHKLAAGIDPSGMPIAWHQRLAGQSIMAGMGFGAPVDPSSVEGAAHMPYAIPNRHVELHSPDKPVTVLWWRSVGHTHTGFVNESFLDEVAHAGGRDPFELRRALLRDEPRHLAVLELAAEKAGWGSPLPEGRGRGIAVRKSFESYVAEVAEVSVEDDGTVRVHRVVCAVDCGVAVNPWNVEAQMESAIVYGLSAALHGEITLEDGRVQQSNFDDYPVLRMDEMPAVEVHIVPSAEPPTGVGEPGVPPIAPAVTNAIFSLTGVRVRRLPIRMSETE